jgi:GNAT superfamily N-acetyltransferase
MSCFDTQFFLAKAEVRYTGEMSNAAANHFSLRLAGPGDLETLRSLMDASMRTLLRAVLSPEEVEASFFVMGLDTQLIEDGTYYVVERAGRTAGCGGWSRRATLFGGDHSAGRSAALLDPKNDAARVRAMYTHPDFTRQGVGTLILGLCEQKAAAEGFKRTELGATLSGLPLYKAYGYREIEQLRVETPSGVCVPIVRMGKTIA